MLSDTRGESKGTGWGFGVDEDTALAITNVGTTAAVAKVSRVNRTGIFHELSLAFVVRFVCQQLKNFL